MGSVIKNILTSLVILCMSLFSGCSGGENEKMIENAPGVNVGDIEQYSGSAYAVVNGNVPYFTEDDYTTQAFESYGELDALNRCTATVACIGTELMPTEDREPIGQVKPSGWHTVKYDFVDGKYLYNRCHLIGFQLTGENANEKNLITGTRYMNVEGMLPFENMVADYVKETKNHVLYRVTPVFEGNNLVASGVLMEGYSVEDNGEGICFNVFCYNIQPGVEIDYATGESKLAQIDESKETSSETANYIANKNSKKFHNPGCSGAVQMKEENKVYLNCTRDEAIKSGYEPCGSCNP